MLRRTLSLALVTLVGVAGTAAAQGAPPADVSTAAVALAASKAEFLGLSIVGNTVSAITVADSSNTGQTFGTITLQPEWDLGPTRFVTVYAYVSAQLTSGTNTIANSSLEADANTNGTATGFVAFGSVNTAHGVTNSNAVILRDINVTGKTKVTSGQTAERTAVTLRLNTTGQHVMPGSYSGSVTFVAHVQ